MKFYGSNCVLCLHSTNSCHSETQKTVGRHFRLPGHDPHRDMVMLPLKVVGGGTFMRRAREKFYIRKLMTEKRLGVEEIEHGLNLDRGQ